MEEKSFLLKKNFFLTRGVKTMLHACAHSSYHITLHQTQLKHSSNVVLIPNTTNLCQWILWARTARTYGLEQSVALPEGKLSLPPPRRGWWKTPSRAVVAVVSMNLKKQKWRLMSLVVGGGGGGGGGGEGEK